MLTLSFNFFAFVRVSVMRQLRKYKIVLFCWLAQEQGRGRGAIFDQTEFFSRVDQGERRERKFFPFALVKLLDAD